MSLASVSIADGSTPAANITDGSIVRVTPGNVLTIALQSGTGIQRWILREDGANINPSSGLPPADGKGYMRQVNVGGPFSVTLQLPNQDCMFPILSSVWDGFQETHARVFLDCRLMGKVLPTHSVRSAIITPLPAYTYSAGMITANANGALGQQDGVALALGDRVLLTLGAAGADNGAYVVTSIGSANAPWSMTRVPDMAHGDVIAAGQVYEVSEGTVYANTQWKNTLPGPWTVGTGSPAPYPRKVSGSAVLVAGTFTISCAVFSTSTTSVALERIVANTCTATAGGYHPTNGGANGITAGPHGTGSIIVQATVAAGTINNADISTLNWMVTNAV